MNYNLKKAVSPLIATILLVAVALSLAGILYSWSSQNAKDTIDNLSDTTDKWNNCNAIELDMEYGCSYDPDDGFNFILLDQSSVEIDENIILTVIDAENTIKTTSFEPNFGSARMMTVNKDIYKNPSELEGLSEPLKEVKVFINSCSEKYYATKNCS